MDDKEEVSLEFREEGLLTPAVAAAGLESRAISGLWRRPIETWKARSGRDDSGKICSFGSGLYLIDLPPLRELPEDIKEFTVFYMKAFLSESVLF